jgi:hypothetical protein
MRKERLMQEPRCNLQGNGRPHHDVVVESVVSELDLHKLHARVPKGAESNSSCCWRGVTRQPQPHMEIALASKH